jgi:glycosyltransferase involved in cell wall biosynthesis
MAHIVVIAPFVPHDGIDHAGGEAVRRHILSLSKNHTISLVAPKTAANDVAVHKNEHGARTVVLVPRSDAWLSRPASPFRGMANLVWGPTFGLEFERNLRRDPMVRTLLQEADLVELQWSETGRLSRFVRRSAPNTPQQIVAHDVLAQKLGRRWRDQTSPIRRAVGLAQAHLWSRGEKRFFAEVGTVVTFSEKDADLVRSTAPTATIHTLPPALADDTMPRRFEPRPASGRVLFAAAFHRHENDEAARWFIQHVWPIVLHARPSATLVLAGSSPSDALREAAARPDAHIEATDYVDSLAPYYAGAQVAVAPLLHGGGVKFKSIIAMLWGLPLVATPVGAEGVGDGSHVFAVTQDAEEFADAVLAALSDPDTDQKASAAFAWAHSTYSSQAFDDALEAIVSRQVTTSTARQPR